MRNTREMISPIAPPTIKIRPMNGTFTWAEDQLTAYRRIAPITMSAMLPPMVTGKSSCHLGAALPQRRFRPASEGRSACRRLSDFQRLRRSQDIDSAPLMAASIVLDALNVCQFFLQIFSRSDR